MGDQGCTYVYGQPQSMGQPYPSSSSSTSQLSPTSALEGSVPTTFGRRPSASRSWIGLADEQGPWSPEEGHTYGAAVPQHIPQQNAQYSNYPSQAHLTYHTQYGLSPREQPSPLLPAFEPSRGPPPELNQTYLHPSSQSEPSSWDGAALVRPSHPLPEPSGGDDRALSRSAAWAILASKNEFRLRPRLSPGLSQPYGPPRPAELSPNWAAVSAAGPQDYFSSRSSLSSSSHATSPSTSMSVSTPMVADSPAVPLRSLDEFPGFTPDVHSGCNKDGVPLLPFPLLPDTNEPNLASVARSVGHSCLSCKKHRRKCQTPNINTRCLFCFRANLACGYAEQKQRREGKKEVDPALPQMERWTLKEGLDANPPLVILCNSEAETSRLLHRKFVARSKPNSDPFTFVTCAKAIELRYAVRFDSSSSSSSSHTTSLPSTTASTPASTPLALPSPALNRSQSHGQRLGVSPLYITTPLTSSSRASTASTSASSLYTPATSASYTPSTGSHPVPPSLSRTESYPDRARGAYIDTTPSSVGLDRRPTREGAKRRKTNPDGMISMGMIGLGIDSGQSNGEQMFGVEIGSPGRGG